MSDVFLDTVGLIAVWDAADQWHSKADAAFQTLVASRCRLITTEAVLLECGNSAARRPYRLRVNALRHVLKNKNLIIEPTPLEMEQAWDAYDRGDAAQAGIVDQISFAVMRRLGIIEAFTNDRHFVAAGFAVLF